MQLEGILNEKTLDELYPAYTEILLNTDTKDIYYFQKPKIHTRKNEAEYKLEKYFLEDPNTLLLAREIILNDNNNSCDFLIIRRYSVEEESTYCLELIEVTYSKREDLQKQFIEHKYRVEHNITNRTNKKVRKVIQMQTMFEKCNSIENKYNVPIYCRILDREDILELL